MPKNIERTERWLDQGGNQPEGLTPNEFENMVDAISAKPTLRQSSEWAVNTWNNMSPVMKVMAIGFVTGGVAAGLSGCVEAIDTDDGYTQELGETEQISSPELTKTLPDPGIAVTPAEVDTQVPTPTSEIIATQETFPGSQDNTFLAVPGFPEGFGGEGEISVFANTRNVQDSLNSQGFAPVVDSEGVLSRTQVQDGSEVCVSNLPDSLYNPDTPSGEDKRISSDSGIVSFGDNAGEVRTKAIGVISTSGFPDEWDCVNAVVTNEENPAGLGALRTLIIDREGDIKAELPAAFEGNANIEIRWEAGNSSLYVNGEVVNPTFREGVDVPVIEQGPPDLSAEGLTQGEITRGLGEQEYIKYYDSEGLVQKVYDSESKEILFAGESVWNAVDDQTGENVKFSVLVVTGKETSEVDGHFTVGKENIEELAKLNVAAAAINYYDQAGKPPLRTDGIGETQRDQLVGRLVTDFIHELALAKQNGENLTAPMKNTRVDPTEVIIELVHDDEARGKWMIYDYGRSKKRVISRESEENHLYMTLTNYEFSASHRFIREDGVTRDAYPSYGWIHDGLLQMITADEIAGRGGVNMFEYGPDLVHSIMRFSSANFSDYNLYGWLYPDLLRGDEIPALDGEWFGGEFLSHNQ